MNRSKSLVARTLAAATLAAAILCPLDARAGIVFGNLGASGATALGTTSTNIGTQDPLDINWIAQGFSTGSATDLTVTAITIGVQSTVPGTLPLTLSIYEETAGVPSAVALYTSSPVTVGVKNKYSFSFSNAVLDPSTTYFVVANGGAWFYNTGTPAAPVEQNSSGYSFVSTLQSFSTSTTPAGPWTAAESSRYSVSVEAVPEPPTLMLAGLGLTGIAVLEGARRRRPRVAAAC